MKDVKKEERMVYISNKLNGMMTASGNESLTVNEHKLFRCYLSLIDPFAEPSEKNLVRSMPYEEWEDFLGVKHLSLDGFNKTAKGLITKKVAFDVHDEDGKKIGMEEFPLLKICEIDDSNPEGRMIKMRVSDEAIDYVMIPPPPILKLLGIQNFNIHR